ncbi:MAG: hypothetical protein ACXU86_06470 [Archangium sp.]
MAGEAMVLRGQVLKKPFAPGSKSERETVVLSTGQGEYVLRRLGGSAFQDPELEALVGKRIRGEGTLHGYTFILASWEEA